MARERRHLAGGDAQIGIGIAGGVGEGRLFQADLARPFGQHGAELGLVAGERFGDGDAGVVRGIDDDAVDEVVELHLAVDGGEHRRAVRRRPALAPGVLADGELVVELDVTLLDFVEHEFERHQLGEARRGDELVAVLLVKNAVAFGIEQQRGGSAGLESLVLLDGHVRGGMSGGNGRDQQGGRTGPKRPPRQQASTMPGHQENLQRARPIV